MKINFFIIIVLSFVLTACVSMERGDHDLRKQVYDKVSQEFVTCSAFFSIVSGEMETSGNKKLVKEANDAMENAFGVALDLARQIHVEDKANEVTWSRFQSSLEGMEQKAGKDYSNISTLRAKHGKRCEWIMTSPEEFMKEITREMQNNQGTSK